VNDSELSLIEVELKFLVDDKDSLLAQLESFDALPQPIENHRDLYFRHPSRDFEKTREALRIRRIVVTQNDSHGEIAVESQSRVTYKGPHLPGGIKARHELEWALQPSDPHGENLEELLLRLGFEPITTVSKVRRPMLLLRQGHQLTVALDEVQNVGSYVEVEVIARGEHEVANARALVERVAAELGLMKPESRSYLSLLLRNLG
jgi:adenylate cyclase class 2